MANDGYSTVRINNLLMERVEKIFHKAGFTTKSGYIQHRLRDSVEIDLEKYSGKDGDTS